LNLPYPWRSRPGRAGRSVNAPGDSFLAGFVCCARLAVSGRREWAAAHPDPSPLADKIGQLSDEIDQLRGLLRQQGTEPEEDTA